MKEEFKNLDEKLTSPGQQAMSRLVRGLPEELPSLSWRSGLNEALRAEAAKVARRKRFLWVARPAFGLSLACALAVVVFIRPLSHGPADRVPPLTPPSFSTGSLEASLIDFHSDSVRLSDVAGTGLNANEATNDVSGSSVSNGDDPEADLEL